MSALRNKKILVGITGSIAAYKSATLVRLLVKAGAEVRVAMTPAACGFITPLTLSTLSRHKVYVDLSEDGTWENHVELGLWADAMLIAPASANTLAHLAQGLCANFLQAVYLSAKCPVFLAPAMDIDMWKHPATRRNITQLERFGNTLLPVGFGELASGLIGEGRMAEPEEMFNYLEDYFSRKEKLLHHFQSRTCLVTAGPTREALDPVRFLSNHSSGKMGYAIAERLAWAGARVHLVSGPTGLPVPAGVEFHPVESARELYDTSLRLFPECQVAVLCAAVADYRPVSPAPEKIKKAGNNLDLRLEKTEDTAAALGQIKQAGQLLVGFALETENGMEHARQKLRNKNLDLIVLNSPRDPGAGFGHDTNQVKFIYPDNKVTEFELKPKIAVADDLLDALCALAPPR